MSDYIWFTVLLILAVIMVIGLIITYLDSQLIWAILGILPTIILIFIAYKNYPQYEYVLYKDGDKLTTCTDENYNIFSNCVNNKSYKNIDVEYKKVRLENSWEINRLFSK